MGERKALKTLKLGLIFCAGIALGVASIWFEAPEQTCEEIDQEIDV